MGASWAQVSGAVAGKLGEANAIAAGALAPITLESYTLSQSTLDGALNLVSGGSVLGSTER